MENIYTYKHRNEQARLVLVELWSIFTSAGFWLGAFAGIVIFEIVIVLGLIGAIYLI